MSGREEGAVKIGAEAGTGAPPGLGGDAAGTLWALFRRSKGAMAGLGFVGFLLAAAYFAPLIANNEPLIIRYEGRWSFPAFRELPPLNHLLPKDAVDLRLAADPDWLLDLPAKPDPRVGFFLLPPVPYSPYQTRLRDVNLGPSLSRRHPFGCDDGGRDVCARMLYGARVSLLVGFLAVGVALVIGVAVGALGGYAGGWVDTVVVSRLIEVMMCFPTFFLLLAVVAVMDPRYLNAWTVMLVIGLTSWPGLARYTRAEFLRLKDSDMAASALAAGAGPVRVAFRHLLPNALTPLLVNATFAIAGSILLESAVSFLGVGVQPPEPSWGNILSLVTRYWSAWWLGLFPGAAIFLSVLSYNLVGEGLREALDPHSAG